ncbi:hypothetical protein HanHA300_Chr08g0270141 [Helianthus annuus]|nr:hypothetical protein HanHA300_Chr08g0270141 [Helianthus annuus]KAJ0552598.1 hypothetical protein HanHA89_Chr08g0286991 [Helianthus annuus]KAJ0718293.1 hypothetical protein HanLR1_Chr08g0269011 [Helianthus annuus]
MPTWMGFQSLWGMGLIKRFDVIDPRFKNRAGGLWIEQPLPEEFDIVYPPPEPIAVLLPDPPVNLDGPAMPQPPPPPPGAPQFPCHVIPGHALVAAVHPEIRAELDRLNDFISWLV